MYRSWKYAIIGVVIVLAAAGCGENQPPPGAPMAKPSPVQGRILLKGGIPLKGGYVTFTPEEVKIGSQIRYEGAGLVDKAGRYKIGFNADDAGVPPGKYKVTVKPRDYQELPRSNSNRIPRQYREPSDTPLVVTVKEEGNTFNFELR
jgi:hypothetical protein